LKLKQATLVVDARFLYCTENTFILLTKNERPASTSLPAMIDDNTGAAYAKLSDTGGGTQDVHGR